jgi:hypothetical protein
MADHSATTLIESPWILRGPLGRSDALILARCADERSDEAFRTTERRAQPGRWGREMDSAETWIQKAKTLPFHR